MKQKSRPDKAPAEQVLRDIRRQTRRQYSTEATVSPARNAALSEFVRSSVARHEFHGGSASGMQRICWPARGLMSPPVVEFPSRPYSPALGFW